MSDRAVAVPDVRAIARAQGCLLGQLAGDALGGMVEFRGAAQISKQYPQGVRDLHDGGHHTTLAGQPTDDSEMALLLARSLVKRGTYDAEDVLASYRYWRDSNPFDIGNTIAAALQGRRDPLSQANGSLMRISPLGIFCAYRTPEEAYAWAREDALLTHPHLVCVQATQLFTRALAEAIAAGPSPAALYSQVLRWAEELPAMPALLATFLAAEHAPPADFMTKMGWVLIALQNAFWQLLHAPTLEEGVVDSVMRGGDTDTNATIAGALLGAVHGLDAVPDRWIRTVLACRPAPGTATAHPRPEVFWPTDALELAEQLLRVSVNRM